jgi:hypothetical protein
MIKRHQQHDALDTKSRALEAENASLQRKLKRLQGSPALDTGSPAVPDAQKVWSKKTDGKPEGSQGTAGKAQAPEQEEHSREDIPIATRKLVKTGSTDVDKPERPKEGGASGGEKQGGAGKGEGGGDKDAKDGVLSMFPGRAAGGALEALVSQARAGWGGEEERLRELLRGAEKVVELEKALAEQKQRADR